MGYLFEKETEQMIGLIYALRNKMGGGWNEEMYHRALVNDFQKSGIPTQSKPQSTLYHRGVAIYTFEPDIIVWDKIILELKVLPRFRRNNFPTENMAQIIHYEKQFGIRLGYLVNFAHSKVGLRPIVYKSPEITVVENYDYIKNLLQQKERTSLQSVRQHIISIANKIGTGFNEVVYRKLIAAEISFHNIDCIFDVHIPVQFEGNEIGTQNSQMLLVANNFLLLVRANLPYPPTYDFIKMQSFLKALRLKVGLVINFNKSEVQIYGVTPQNHPPSILSKSKTKTA